MTVWSEQRLRIVTMALLSALGGVGLTGCASEASTAGDAAEAVAARAESYHRTILTVRARKPASTGEPAIQEGLGNLESSTTGSGSTGPNGETVWVLPVTARVINGGGLSYTDVALGGCLRVTATVGRADGKVGERGRVTSEPVPCPAGTSLDEYGQPAKEIAIDMDTLRDDVPEAPYERRACTSGAPENCVGG